MPVPLARVGRPRAWPTTCAAQAANGAPRAVRRPTDQRHVAQPLATDDTRECSPALRSDQRSHRRLGMCARSGTARTAVADVAAHDVVPERVLAFPVLIVFH
jgi:hypothetical protein